MSQRAPTVQLPCIQHPADHPLMTVRQAAAVLGCSGMTIRRRIAAKQFPAVVIGSKALVPRAFVDSLIRSAAAGQTVILEEFVATWSAAGGS